MRSFFWSVFSRIQIEYGDLRCKYSYSAQIQENKDQNYVFGRFHAVQVGFAKYSHLCQ